jgi:TRAP-type uncharacterized transport system fused permease subunit
LDFFVSVGLGFKKGPRDLFNALKKGLVSALVGLGGALDQGAKMALTVAVACICAGIIVGVITLSGFGLRFSSMSLC